MSAQVIRGRYVIEAKIGSGSMGEVHRARDLTLDRAVAVKCIAPALAHDPGVIARFEHEARALASVRSPHVVQVFDYGVDEGVLFIVMEHVQGRDLDDVIAESVANAVRLPLLESVTLLEQVAQGLAAVHRAGIVHRDVKPSNVMIEERTGRPVLIDFGVSLRKGSADDGAAELPLAGTPSYLAPEVAPPSGFVAASIITGGADIYALGCTAFELLTGRAPFHERTLGSVLTRPRDEVAPLLSSLRPELAILDAIVAGCLSCDPDDRYASCDELAMDLAMVRAALAPRATSPSLRPARMRRASLPPPRSPREEPASSTVPRPWRAIVVDDDAAFCRFASAALQLAARQRGVELRFATSGMEAIAAFEAEPADLVLLDVSMPELDGGSTLTMLRMLPRGREARVVMCSGHAAAHDKWRFARMGVRDFVTKPVSLEALSSFLHELMEDSQPSVVRSLLATA